LSLKTDEGRTGEEKTMGAAEQLIRRAHSVLNRVAAGANVLGTLVVFALVAVMNVDVVARGIFHAPFRGVVEVVIFSMILIVFLQLPDVVRVDRLTRSDGFLAVIGERRPGMARLLARIIDAIACVFMGLIVWTMWPELVDAFGSCHYFTPPEFGPKPSGYFWQDFNAANARCDYFGTPGILKAPWWPARLAIVFGVALCCTLFAFKALTGARQPERIHLEPPTANSTAGEPEA
jgi:TRAP-type C4-dicarboxylate transport system permease small subunit